MYHVVILLDRYRKGGWYSATATRNVLMVSSSVEVVLVELYLNSY